MDDQEDTSPEIQNELLLATCTKMFSMQSWLMKQQTAQTVNMQFVVCLHGGDGDFQVHEVL